MNKIQSLAAICALLCGATASAQFTTGGKSNGGSSASTQEIAPYNQFGISYTNVKYTWDIPGGNDDMDDISTNGVSLKYIHGFSVSQKLPMYVETGLNLNFGFAKIYGEEEEDYAYFQKYQFAALAIPVNFAYKFNINDNIAIKPYIGLNFKFNLLGRTKGEIEIYDEDLEDYFDEEDLESKWGSLYSKKDMGDKDAVWNRFQMGWHIGADVQFNKFYVGLNYGTDFIPAWKYKKYKVNSGTFNIGIGVCF